MKNKHNSVHTDQSGNSEFVIVELLPIGKENAISTKELVCLAGCNSSRDLQQRIAEERKAGAIILSSSSGGYYRPANRAEMMKFSKTLEKRAIYTLVALRSVRRALKVPEGQQLIEEGENTNEK